MKDVVIVAAVRTPIGCFQGRYRTILPLNWEVMSFRRFSIAAGFTPDR
jgi:acetyl-CoA acetyltransferase